MVNGNVKHITLSSIVVVILISLNYIRPYPAVNYMFKVNSRNIRTRCEMCSKLAIKTPEDVSDVVLVSLLLPLNIFHTLF